MPDRPGDMDERDVDARFASIVAQWEGSVPDADNPHPEHAAGPDAVAPAGAPVTDDASSTDGSDDASRTAAADDEVEVEEEPGQTEATAPPAVSSSPWVNPSPLDVVVPASAWRAAEPTDPGTERAAAEAEAALEESASDEPHFEPPEVVLPPQEDLSFWGAVIGLVAGPLMLLYVVFARPFHSTRWFTAAVVVSLLGFALLVLRQPTHRDPTSGDDGARV